MSCGTVTAIDIGLWYLCYVRTFHFSPFTLKVSLC